VKPLTDFARNRSTKSGYSYYCKPCHNKITRENRIKHHGSTRQFQLKRRYGIDAVQVAWMCLQQGDVCAICRTAKPVHVDHDHQSGVVRGILCFNCNRGLAKLGEDPELMRTAIAYLKEADEGD
jgi:hypothetical protein